MRLAHGGIEARVSEPGRVTAEFDHCRYLAGLRNYETTRHSAPPAFDRMPVLMRALGDPQDQLNAIHITGTNGKGSVAAMASALLVASRLRVGTYTSPHLFAVNERIAVDGVPIIDTELAGALLEVSSAAAAAEVSPTWFEAITAAAIWHFAHTGVDVAVIEVGMLGRFDATNVIDASVAVVTNVELDHVEVAGPTRELIALEKAGIVKPGATLVLGERDPLLLPVFEQQLPRDILMLGRDVLTLDHGEPTGGSVATISNRWGVHDRVEIAMTGAFQVSNAALALTAVEAHSDRHLDATAVSEVFRAVTVAGRFQVVRGGPTVILDCAHNEAAALALRPLIKRDVPRSAPTVLLCGLIGNRDPFHFLSNLSVTTFDHVVATEPESPRALLAADIAIAAESLGARVVEEPKIDSALSRALDLAGPRGTVLVVGSHYLVGPVAEALRRAHP
ncbi:bifunctional folylpolyglutamate synthase/dihydrofolate synthase [Mycobacterium sp. BMJ-28]